MNIFCSLDDLKNESDVEQKLFYKILTSDIPNGLGFLPSEILTKTQIKTVSIDKGLSAKKYYPDYVIHFRGLPLIVCEIKAPYEDVDLGFREARLYANEINSLYPTGLNPCCYVISTNGKKLLSGNCDSAIPNLVLNFEDIGSASENYSAFYKKYSRDTITAIGESLLTQIRGKSLFSKPVRHLGGEYFQNAELVPNSFGETISLEYRGLFNPITKEERREIARNAYVASRSRQKHVRPIDRVIRSAFAKSSRAIELNDSSQPVELISVLDRVHNGDMIVLIGGVGTGKSTFIDYLFEVALPEDIKAKTVCLPLNLNSAPLSEEEIYTWVKKTLINELSNLAKNQGIDIADYTEIEKIYKNELNDFKKGALSILDQNSSARSELLAKKILDLQTDKDITLTSLLRFLCADRGKVPIVVFDNVDKGDKKAQLLMFQVAKWVQTTFKLLIILSLRDSTFDLHRNEPPLDTVIQDLVFRIDPPTFSEVINKRISFALRKFKGQELFCLSGNTNVRVSISFDAQKRFLLAISRSLFENNFSRSLITGIAGRDIRRGIEIFLNFCKSGHIREEYILSIASSGGNNTLPIDLITRVILRKNREYYVDRSSGVRNIFASDINDKIPDPFLRLVILRWLLSKDREIGPSGQRGYHLVETIIKDLVFCGHDEKSIIREINELVLADYISSESNNYIDQPLENKSYLIATDENVTITARGRTLLWLCNNVDYLATIAEDVWFDNPLISKRIHDRMVGLLGDGHFSRTTTIKNASDLVLYLDNYKQKYLPNGVLSNNFYTELMSLETIKELINKHKKYIIIDYEQIENDNPPGKIVECKVLSVKEDAYFVELSGGAIGSIYRHSLRNFTNEKSGLKPAQGDLVECKVLGFTRAPHNKVDLELIRVLKH